jgi:hypothetical protein
VGFLDPLQHFHAVDLRHHDVEHEDIDRRLFLDALQRLQPAARRIDVEVAAGERAQAAAHDDLLVIDDQNPLLHCRPRFVASSPPLAGGSSGRYTRNVEPSPGLLSTSITPPCASTMPWLTDSPRPVPLPTSFEL